MQLRERPSEIFHVRGAIARRFSKSPISAKCNVFLVREKLQ